MLTDWVPTIWLMGVTSGGYPSSLRVLGISSSTSSRRSNAPVSRSWESRLLAIPPGIWWLNTLTSITAALGLSMSALYLGRTSSSLSPSRSSFCRSRPLSRSVLHRVTTMGSTAGWEVRSARGARHASTTSTPASMAFSAVIDAMPLV